MLKVLHGYLVFHCKKEYSFSEAYSYQRAVSETAGDLHAHKDKQ